MDDIALTCRRRIVFAQIKQAPISAGTNLDLYRLLSTGADADAKAMLALALTIEALPERPGLPSDGA